MILLVTGLSGFVAGSVVAQANKDWEVHGISRSEVPGLPIEIHAHHFDLLEKEKVAALFNEIKPDAVIHTAAIANIDICQNDPELGKRINVEITETIVELCKSLGSKLVFCSTDSVFDGINGHYTETDEPHPINVYADTKVKAEQMVLAASPKNIVARLALVMGLPVYGKGNSFLADMLDKSSRQEPIKFPANEIRTPIDVVTLGAALVELAGNDFGGIVHLSGNSRLTRYEMGLQIAESVGIPLNLVVSTDSNSMPGRAPRANDASMDNSLACRILKTPMLSLTEGLDLTLNFKK